MLAMSKQGQRENGPWSACLPMTAVYRSPPLLPQHLLERCVLVARPLMCLPPNCNPPYSDITKLDALRAI